MEEKKDFPILIFALLFFYQVFIELFDLPENAIVYIICSRCPKIACFTKTLWRIWGTKVKNDIPSLALVEII